MEIINHKGKHYLKTETGYREILASTDKSLFPEETKDCIGWYPEIPQSFIEYFVSEYNKGNIITEVMVEYEGIVLSTTSENDYDKLKLKINPKDNTITIKKVKDNFTLQEINDILDEFKNEEICKKIKKRFGEM